MSDITLGMDLGTNSIGWALIDEGRSRLVACGARVFPEGVDRDQKGGELSKSETRRNKRGARRQTARRARRKMLMRKELTRAGLLPGEPAELEKLLLLDPYELRRRALDEPLSPHETGRLLVHLNQRRGFLSNRKSDSQRKSETSAMLDEISELENEIEAAGHRTLGEHLACLREEPEVRIRNRHTRRDMYEREFDAVWEAQRRHHPNLFDR